MTEILDEIPEFEPVEDKQLLEMGIPVYGVADPNFCGIITGVLLDINDCVTYRVNDKFYYANELTVEKDEPKRVKGLK